MRTPWQTSPHYIERTKAAGLYVRCAKLLWETEFSTGLCVRNEAAGAGPCVRIVGTLRALSIYPVEPSKDPVVGTAIGADLWKSAATKPRRDSAGESEVSECRYIGKYESRILKAELRTYRQKVIFEMPLHVAISGHKATSQD